MKRITAHYPTPRSLRVQVVAVATAGVLALMLVAQLYAYENFASILSTLLPYSDQTLITISAAVIVIGELFTLPWLLGMKLSRLFRAKSAIAAALIAAFWLLTALTNSHAINSGILGEKVAIPGGLLAFAWSSLLLSGVIYVLYNDTRPSTT